MLKRLLLLAALMTAAVAHADENVNVFDPSAFPGFGRVCFFADVDYQGASVCINGAGRDSDLRNDGWNDAISSILIEGFAKADVYGDVGYSGGRLRVERSIPDLRTLGWNDAISSLKTRVEVVFPIPVPTPPLAPAGQVCFYESVNYEGAKICLKTGYKASDLRRNGWNDRISSVAVGARARAILYDDVFNSGASITLNRSNADLREIGWNDRASSLRARTR
jgi:hypothetical protein